MTGGGSGPAIGVVMILTYTALISGADAITKLIAGGYAAPQLFCLSGLIAVCLSLLADRHPQQRRGIATRCPRAMALRSGATVLASVCFFYAFKYLPFAQVFLFIGLMPLFAGVLSGAVLNERPSPAAWTALLAGSFGILCLFPSGISAVGFEHAVALAASVSGTVSMVLARYVSRFETNSLAQVFYPNFALFVTMGVALPFVWVPMAPSDVAWVLVYSTVLFMARWLSVVALRLLAAHVVTPLMNLQFVWMVAMGVVFFNEYPLIGTYIGSAIVIGSGAFLAWDQIAPNTRLRLSAENLVGKSNDLSAVKPVGSASG